METKICERCMQPYEQDSERLDVCDECEKIIEEEENLSDRLNDKFE